MKSKFSDLRVVHDRLLPKPEVLHITGFSSATLWREIQCKRFPAPVPISPHRVGFLESEVIAWLRAAKAARDLKCVAPQAKSDPTPTSRVSNVPVAAA
jgi:predicted DNA-binding transcriptional regulator AlpA